MCIGKKERRFCIKEGEIIFYIRERERGGEKFSVLEREGERKLCIRKKKERKKVPY